MLYARLSDTDIAFLICLAFRHSIGVYNIDLAEDDISKCHEIYYFAINFRDMIMICGKYNRNFFWLRVLTGLIMRTEG